MRMRLHMRLFTLSNLDSSTSTTATLRTVSSTMAIHPRLGFIDIDTKGYHPASAWVTRWFSLQSHRTNIPTTGGMSVRWLLVVLYKPGKLQDFSINRKSLASY
jgi:hypothetical protein